MDDDALGELAFLSCAAAGRMLRSGAIAATDLLDAVLGRIAAFDGSLHAFIHLDIEAARHGAAIADADLRAGFDRGPLHGLPVGIKDLFDVEGMPTRWNSRLSRGSAAAGDAAAVAALRAGGAVLLGKLTTWECAVGTTSFDLPWPPARNPWSGEREAGGSSSGSAAAVAAGFCFGALGSDTGGSIREPASWCGVAGLKPTHGLVPAAGGLPASFILDHVGPMARTSADCAAMLDAMVPGCRSLARIDDRIAGIDVGVAAFDPAEGLNLDPAVAAALDITSEALRANGARLRTVRLPELRLFSAVVAVIASAEGFAIHRDRLAANADRYDPTTRDRLAAGARVAATDYVDAMCLRQQLTEQVDTILSGCHVLLMPVTSSPAVLLGGFDSHGGQPSLCRPWNTTGRPALSIPIGLSADGLPVAVQIVGRRHEDDLVLRVGHGIEQLRGVWRRAPDPRPEVFPDAWTLTEPGCAMEALERAISLVRGAGVRG